MRITDNELIALCTDLIGKDNVSLFERLEPNLHRRIVNSLAPDSLPPACVIYPQTIAELSGAITLAYNYSLRVLPCGNATKLDWGGLVSRADLVVSTAGLDRTIEHCVGDLTVTVEAGGKYRDLQTLLAKQGQFLAIDPPYAAEATMGGILATGSSGSLRHRYNSVRDMCLGIEFVRADGALVKAGGRVVKNVAGYDLMKLLTGSYGTLGIVSSITFRLYPLPESTQIVVLTGTAEAIAAAQQQISTSVLTPTACDLLSATAIADLGLGQEMGLVMQFSSLKASVIEQGDRLATLAKELNLEVQVLGETREFWELLEILIWQDELRNLAPALAPSTPSTPSTDNEDYIICKLGILPSVSVAFLQQCEQIFDSQSYYLQIHTGSGLGILRVEEVGDLEAIATQIAKVRSLVEAHQGFLTILEAPQELKFKTNVWGYQGNASDLMGKIRQQFDARGLLSPNRMFS
ncbi:MULTISPECIES: FAD-binding oxidoreductase [Pseudanabaena]|uniref:FAD linked oxidase domain protein n=2 Tax=Pseudanabaena TaxID=1152 RepID=L8N698_9CYAN|nr:MULTISPECIES: FAD-binding oxidoreductase [Pseudanabaena]ELS33748.1 FAD linked oxidase domain protein [Pseudanabaena biceps PCC 7429]MDG3494027.1 FAD-binding oxidoreductase [Pseudanabaena catenata USMAC16]